MKINEIMAMTHKDFAVKIKTFKASCEKAGIECTKRQASKYRLKKGKAYMAKEASK